MEFTHSEGRVYACDPDGKLLAEVTFPVTNGVANINHTFVDAALRGQNIASQLLEAAVEQIRKNGWKAQTTCSYAVKWFSQHPEASDLL